MRCSIHGQAWSTRTLLTNGSGWGGRCGHDDASSTPRRPISVVATSAARLRIDEMRALRCSVAPRISATWIAESVAANPHRPPGSESQVIAGPAVMDTDLPLKLFSRGKVRDTYELGPRSEEHTSELQSRLHLVCRLLLEK